MQTRRRVTGVNVLGDLAWGSHVCVFYQTRQDLLDVLLPYFSAGLDTGEACTWIVSGPLTPADAEAALRRARPQFERELGRGAIEILDGGAWYLDGGRVDWQRLIHGAETKLKSALDRGFEGLRASGNLIWSDVSTFEALNEYEHALHRMLRGRRMLLLCTYSLLSSTAADVFDVVSAHEITVARRNGTWQFMEPADVQDRARTLTEREREVLSWIARGKTAIEIALILGITKRTVDEHTHNATRKLAAVNRAQAVAVALRSRLIEM